MRCISCMREIEDGSQHCCFCGFQQNTPQKDPDALAPGSVLMMDRLLIGRELGSGGFGITYIGYHKYLNRKLAVKEFFPKSLAYRKAGEKALYCSDDTVMEQGIQNVIREAQKMDKLGNIECAVHVSDVFRENNTAYIVMDYVEGITLKEYLQKHGVLSPEECMRLMRPILDGMSKIHANGIIHRDISPDNLMVQPDGSVRILDLGAAKDTQMESGYTTLVARNGFSPPEQYRSEGKIGAWTDVYALCATMYYSLTGKVPRNALDRGPYEHEMMYPPDCKLSMAWRQAINRGMDMNVSCRTASMSELRDQLEACLNGGKYVPAVEEPVTDNRNYPPQYYSINNESQNQYQHSSANPVNPHQGGSGNPYQNGSVNQYSYNIGSSGQPPKPMEDPIEHSQYRPVTKVESVSTYVTKPQPPIYNPYPPVEPEKKGLFGSIKQLFGGKKEQGKSSKRKPSIVTIQNPDAPVTMVDPNATVCLDGGYGEETVLFDAPGASGTASPMNAYLTQKSNGKQIPITKCSFTLGRFARDSGIGRQMADGVFDDPLKHISRRHAVVIFDGECFYLQDISSRNVTSINGVRLINGVMPENRCVYPTAYRLFDGDSICLAEYELTFHTGGSL